MKSAVLVTKPAEPSKAEGTVISFPKSDKRSPVIRRIEFTSASNCSPNSAELLRLIAQCDRNQDRGITGFLHFDRHRFHQVIEGPQDAVEALWSRVRRDVRHHSVLVQSDEIVGARFYREFDTLYRAELAATLRSQGVRLPSLNRKIWPPQASGAAC